MDKDFDKLSPSRQSAAKTIFESFKILKAAGGQLSGKEVIQKIRDTVQFTEWEKEIYISTGYVRWESILHFYTIDCTKAGFLRKNKRIWYLTSEGEKAMALGAVKLLEAATTAYRQWAVKNRDNEAKAETEPTELEEHKTQTQKASLEQLEEQAISGIKDFINSKNPYEFQDLVAALLRAMKYHTPFIT